MRSAVLALVLVLVMCAGCASTPTETFHALSPVAEVPRASAAVSATSAAATAASAPAVVVDQASVPELVDRPQIVVSTGDSRVVLLEQQRWAEPLRSQISRTIALDLTRLLAPARVSTNPDILDGADEARSYRIALDVQRFESRLDDRATIELLWTIRRSAGQIVTSGREVVTERASGAGYEALIGAHGRALATVSRTIAAALRLQLSRGN